MAFATYSPLRKGVLAVCATGLVTTTTVGTGIVTAVASGRWDGASSHQGAVSHHHFWLSDGSGPAEPGASATSLPTATTLPTSSVTTASVTTATTLPTSSVTTLPTASVGSGPASVMPDSIFDSNVSNWALDPASSAVVANIVAQYESAYGEVAVNFNRPVYEAAANTPDVEVTVASGCSDFTGNQASPNGSGATGTEVPIPSYAVAGPSSDEILTVYQPSSNQEWEFWLAKDNGGSWSACWGGEESLTSDGVFPYPYGETASGISNLATEITERDIAAGSIDHAIGFEVLGDECDWSGTSSHGGLSPANRSDCGDDIAGAPAEGQWFRFPAGLAMPSGLSPFAQMVFKAVQNYGMVIVDQGGAVALEADQPSVWAAEGNSGTDPITASVDGLQGYQVVASLPWQDLEAVDPPQS